MDRFIFCLLLGAGSLSAAEAQTDGTAFQTAEINGLHVPVAECAEVAPGLCRLRESTEHVLLLCPDAVEKLLSKYTNLGSTAQFDVQDLLRYALAHHSPEALRMLTLSEDGRRLIRRNAEEIVRRYADEIVVLCLDERFANEVAAILWSDPRIQDGRVLAAIFYALPSSNQEDLSGALESFGEKTREAFIGELRRLAKERGRRTHVTAALDIAAAKEERRLPSPVKRGISAPTAVPLVVVSLLAALAILFCRCVWRKRAPAAALSPEEREELRHLLRSFSVSAKDGTIEDLTKSYHRLAMVVHPDGSGDARVFSELARSFSRAKLLLGKRSHGC